MVDQERVAELSVLDRMVEYLYYNVEVVLISFRTLREYVVKNLRSRTLCSRATGPLLRMRIEGGRTAYHTYIDNATNRSP